MAFNLDLEDQQLEHLGETCENLNRRFAVTIKEAKSETLFLPFVVWLLVGSVTPLLIGNLLEFVLGRSIIASCFQWLGLLGLFGITWFILIVEWPAMPIILKSRCRLFFNTAFDKITPRFLTEMVFSGYEHSKETHELMQSLSGNTVRGLFMQPTISCDGEMDLIILRHRVCHVETFVKTRKQYLINLRDTVCAMDILPLELSKMCASFVCPREIAQ